MTEQEIVDAFKWNVNPFMFMPEEAKDFAKKYRGDVEILFCDGKWHKQTEVNYKANMTYRLRPDFELPKKEEFEYLPIQQHKACCGRLIWVYTETDGREYGVHEAISIVGFEGYTIDADDSCEPRREFEPKHQFVKIRKDVK